jgi:hypothetical protein
MATTGHSGEAVFKLWPLFVKVDDVQEVLVYLHEL